MKIRNIVIVFLITCIAQSITAQRLIPRAEVETIKQYDQLLVEKYPGFMDRKIVTKVYDLGDSYSRIEYMDNGVLTEELVYERDLTKVIIAKLVKIQEEKVPGPALDAFKQSPEAAYKVNGYFEVSPTFGQPVYYAIEYIKDGKRERKYYSTLGMEMDRPK